MKSVIFVTLALVAIATAASIEKAVPQIVEQTFDVNPDGSFQQRFRTDDGTYRQEVGTLKQVLDEDNKPRDVIVVKGVYGYIKADGQNEEVNYTADENGYAASGPSIPTNPPTYK